MSMFKKGQMAELLIVVFVVIMFLLFLPTLTNMNKQNIAKTPEQLENERYASYVEWHSSEAKYCASQNMLLNDTYVINDCRLVACKNETGIATYKFCSSKDDGPGFGSGLLVGWLVFGK